MAHQHGTTEDMAWAGLVEELSLAAEVSRQVDAEVAAWLLEGMERLLVDLGCGAGGMAAALLSASEQARVIAVDGEPALLEATRLRAGTADRLEVVQADLSAGIPAAVDAADVIWAGSVVHHLPDQQAALNELSARLTPGGRLALGEGGLRSRTLPWDLGVGEPGLELRLDAAQERWFTQMRRDLPGAVPMPYGWPSALRRAGLVDVTSRSFLLDVSAPLGQREAEHVIGRLRRLLDHESLVAQIGAEDRQLLQRLVDPDDAINHDSAEDMFLLAVSTVHVGRRPA